jgi:murein DD-endopeptidase MepM/ murein hydrolase activator NlpD
VKLTVVALLWLAGPCLTPPVPGPIVVPFRQPACSYCPGHRGVEYAPAPGTPVHAVAGGVVTFAGTVAGTLYVVLRQDDGLLATYGFLQAAAVRVGQRVAQGAVVGASSARLYFGWRRDGVPVDPTAALTGARARPWLVPTDGARPRPGPRGGGCLAATVSPSARAPAVGVTWGRAR